LRRNKRKKIDGDERKFIKVVKTAFSQRRKTLRNALKSLNLVDENTASQYLSLRAEQLSVEDFMNLTSCFE
jgi:16S rRNA (adenine1518-N6/adenine1519-N6)-dimethyltransferase